VEFKTKESDRMLMKAFLLLLSQILEHIERLVDLLQRDESKHSKDEDVQGGIEEIDEDMAVTEV
jgi:hypothetical protein